MIENLINFGLDVTDELVGCLNDMHDDQIERFMNDFDKAKRVFLWAPGRIQNMMRTFARRINNTGKKTVYIVGDTITPAIGEGDFLVVGSGAGHNIGLASIAERARGFGATVALLTIVNESLDQKASDYIVIVPGRTAALGGIGVSIQPGGAKLEQSILFFLEAIAMKYEGKNSDVKKAAMSLPKAVKEVLPSVNKIEYDRLVELVENKKETNRIYTYSLSHRQNNLLRCYLMRLMHIGFKAYVYNDSNSPEPSKGDVVVVSDYTGEDLATYEYIKKFKNNGATVVLITTNSNSACGKLADFCIDYKAENEILFDHTLIIVVDVMIAKHIETSGRGMKTGFNLHANLE